MKKDKTIAMLENLYKETNDSRLKEELQEKIAVLKNDKDILK